MSRGMSRGGSGFPIIIAVLGVLILGVIGIFIYMQLSGGSDSAMNNDAIATTAPTEAPTAIPTVAPATPEPTPEVVVTVPPTTPEPTAEATEATPTPYITAPPLVTSDTVWINVDALVIHTQANFTSDTVGKIPYGQQVSGDRSGKWLNVSYDGSQGYIYLGKTSAGRACVVSSEAALQALEEDPDAEETDLVTSISKDSVSGGYMNVTVRFSSQVYSDDDKTGDITASDFTVTGGTLISDNISGKIAGTEMVTLKIQLLVDATEVTVTVKSQAIFNASGNAANSESATLPVS